MQKKIAAKEICHTYFKQNGKSAALQINYKEFMTMSKVSQIITETVLKRMEEAEKNGEVFYWVKPFSEGSPNKPCFADVQSLFRFQTARFFSRCDLFGIVGKHID